MRKNVITFCLVGSLLIFMNTIHAWDMLTMFLLVGIVPGTNLTLTPAQRMTLMSILAIIVISRSIILPLMRKFGTINAKQNKITTRRLKRV